MWTKKYRLEEQDIDQLNIKTTVTKPEGDLMDLCVCVLEEMRSNKKSAEYYSNSRMTFSIKHY